ncbi:unnamed protein product [Arctia plantaginis]|uniref:Peptidase S1 domain-containing protein n=1 Tax=Arctia plantaginis TaxID=874455 RepID=A0A8S1AJJ8_ARCPL|nr:unnamed protein product [Arctia plantaginis]
MEEDLTHLRRKRLTTETGLVCLEDYPYTVSVRLHGKHWCGGAIIGPLWVLTAAQCFDYVAKDEVTVRMGSVFRDFGGRIVSVVDIRRHPDYKMDQYYPEHNLAMVKVNVQIVSTSRMQPVALAIADADLPPLFGETVVTGYGSVVTGQIREGENQELRRMIVREVSRGECRLIYGNDYHLQHDNMCLLSVTKGVALCAGDTGDPAVHFSGVNRAGTLYGIALFSGTEECAYKSKPGVFAKVSYSRLWIDKVLEEIPEHTESADSTENVIPLDVEILSGLGRPSFGSFDSDMDELKHRAGEKLEALHVAAKTAADNGKTRVHDVVHQTAEAIQRLREAFHSLWHHELIAEGRARAVAWTKEAVRRVKEGAPPLSPMLLYEELVTLFHDRVWRRSIIIFACGVALGGSAGVLVGLRAARLTPTGPTARALHSHTDQAVILVEDAVSPGVGAGEVLVRVQAFSICSVDRGALRGRAHCLRSLVYRGHVTVGRGFAGIVLDVGYGVLDLEMGDEVWGCVSEWSGGAATELLTIRSSRLSKRPRGLSADSAAALPWAGARALAALRSLAYAPHNCKGKRVAVLGAASGEGCALVQLLSAWGAAVTALAPRHAALTLRDLGAQEFVDVEGTRTNPWASLEASARSTGPWDCVLACDGAGASPANGANPAALLKATAPRGALLDLRARPLLTDRLPMPFSLLFVTSFYTYRLLRWLTGCGTHTDWLEDRHMLRGGLDALAKLVDTGSLAPILDKVYLPQDFEVALAHACSDDAIGTTVVRFP